MSPLMIEAVALLLAEAIKAGVSISALLQEAREQGGISEATWADILVDLDAAEDLWHGTGAG